VPDFDVLVIGGGIAGLRAAIAARRTGASVALVSKTHPLRTNSAIAAGGLNAPLGSDDSVGDFAQDILAVGDGLCDPKIVDVFAESARDEIIWLDRMGLPFNRDSAGKLARRPFGANRRNRTCYTDDLIGHNVLQVVYEQFQRERIPIFNDTFVTSLTVDGGNCMGVTALQLRPGTFDLLTSRAVILATGGFTRMYRPSTASAGTTGDGHRLASLAGARLLDLEMIQFHPTVFPGKDGLLVTEAALAEGAEIVNQKGEAILQAKFEPREKLSQSIHRALGNGASGAAVDLRPIGKDKLSRLFPQTCELVQAVAGLDVTKESVPIYPAAHRPIGGIEADASGQTSINGLFAVGECACSGLNGAGRLAGNTLTEMLVFGRITGEAAAGYARSAAKKNLSSSVLRDEERRLSALTGGAPASSDDTPLKLHAELASSMNDKAGLVRDDSSLRAVLEQARRLKARHAQMKLRNTSKIYNYELTSYLEIGSLLYLAEALTMAALARTESRGAHCRTDFPSHNDAQWSCHTVVSQINGEMKVDTKPVAAR